MYPSARVQQKLPPLPILRFTSAVIVLVAVGSLVCISLWIAGGDSLYIEDSVTKYSFTHSTFDLACISAVRCILLVICFYYLEKYSLLKVSESHDKQLANTRMVIVCQLSILLMSGLSLLYASVKGGLILKSIIQGKWNDIDPELRMHITYKALCIASIVFPAIEVVLGIISSWCLRRMIRVKRLHLLVNLQDEDQKTEKKKADIKRIFLLAKPVSTSMHV